MWGFQKALLISQWKTQYPHSDSKEFCASGTRKRGSRVFWKSNFDFNQQPALSDGYLVPSSLFARTAGGDGFSHAGWSGKYFKRREGNAIEQVTDGPMALRPSAFFVAEFAVPQWKLLSYFETWILVVAKLQLAVLARSAERNLVTKSKTIK